MIVCGGCCLHIELVRICCGESFDHSRIFVCCLEGEMSCLVKTILAVAVASMLIRRREQGGRRSMLHVCLVPFVFLLVPSHSILSFLDLYPLQVGICAHERLSFAGGDLSLMEIGLLPMREMQMVEASPLDAKSSISMIDGGLI